MMPRSAVPCRPAFLLLALLALLLPGLARAAELASDWSVTKQGRVRLLAAPGAAGALRLGLQFQLAPGWKIYWRAPGDAGLPPEADWAGSTNLKIGETSWPVPERFSYAGLETFGYEGEIVLPIVATVPDPKAPVHATGKLSFLTCAAICVPNDVDLSLVIPAGAGPSPDSAALIDRFAARAPGTVDQAGLFIRNVTLTASGKDAILGVEVRGTPALAKPDVLIEGGDGFSFQPPKLTSTWDGMPLLNLVMPGAAATMKKLDHHPLYLTVVDRAAPESAPRAARFGVYAQIVEWQPPAAPQGFAVASVLALALLGGFILNFMPCVLPVLSMKLVALVAHAGQGRRATRLGFLASSAGIIASFLAMAGILIAMRSAGLAVGWGIQFQQPVFLAVLAAIVTLFACNLFGWFEINLPSGLANLVPGGGASLGANFLTGAFATVLATPCSAPFLGTAVGFALAGSALDILLVFLCLGIGLALPYLAVAAFPDVARLMPRPGHWMLVLRRMLGILLAGTAAWLILVLVAEAGEQAGLVVGALGLVGALVLALAARFKIPVVRRALAVIAALLLLGMPLPPLLDRLDLAPPAQADAGWVPFDEASIAGAVAAGKTVFVDVTATWCLTCQVNERLVLDSNRIHGRLTATTVVAMRADWTRRDTKIGDYLKTYGRYGIPFNVVYGPAAPGGLPLPELLTEDAVLTALRQASGQAS